MYYIIFYFIYRDAQQNLDKSQNDLQHFMAKVTLLAAHVDSLHHLKKQIETDEKIKSKLTLEDCEFVHKCVKMFTFDFLRLGSR